MNNYEEIRNLLKASRTMLGGEKMVKESFEIKKNLTPSLNALAYL